MIASLEKVSPKSLEFRVFHATAIEGKSLSLVARGLGISRARAVQLRDRVSGWLARQAAAAGGPQEEQRRRASEYVAWARLDHLFHLSIEAWEASKGDETIVQRIGLDHRVTTTRSSCGKICYLTLASRISAQQTKLAMPMLPELEIDEHDEQYEVAMEAALNPPVGDCSPKMAAAPQLDEEEVGEDDTVFEPATTCDGEVDRPFPFLRPENADFSPVHPAVQSAGSTSAWPSAMAQWRGGVLLGEEPVDEEEDAVTAAAAARSATSETALFSGEAPHSPSNMAPIDDGAGEDAENLVEEILAEQMSDEVPSEEGPMSFPMRPLSRKERRRRQRLLSRTRRRAK